MPPKPRKAGKLTFRAVGGGWEVFLQLEVGQCCWRWRDLRQPRQTAHTASQLRLNLSEVVFTERLQSGVDVMDTGYILLTSLNFKN